MSHPLYRELPKVDRLVEDPRLSGLPHDLVVGAARQVLDELRQGIADGLQALPDVGAAVLDRAQMLHRGRIHRVINATGVVVHTNLGRAPWDPAVAAAVQEATGYCNVELDLATGKRGGRMDAVTALARHLTGAQAALVVNNCAAAVLLAVTALGAGREVVVSRGELVEIGGSFRVPDVVASGGAVLREVGTTNRTRAADYAAAITPRTAVLLRVHPSNFRIEGFTEAPRREELVALAAQHGLAVVEDIGSGALEGLEDEPSVREAVGSGVDVVLFSGDKLLGGPQAGLCVGRADAIERMRRHPLYRALRVDKVILAAVERTLALHASGRLPPVRRMIAAGPAELEPRARALEAALHEAGVPSAFCDDDVGRVGGGALASLALPTRVVRVPVQNADRVMSTLRGGEPPIVARLSDGHLVLDARTLCDSEVGAVAKAVAHAVEKA